MHIQYPGGLRCEVRHGPSGTQIETDAPTDNAGKGESFSPTDLLGAALVSCAITTIGIKAPKEGIGFPGASGRVRKIMTTKAPRRIARLEAVIDFAPGVADSDKARLEAIAKGCPVALSLNEQIESIFTFSYAQ